MLLFFKWYQEWFIDCDYIPSQSQIDAMEDAWNGAIEATQQAAQDSERYCPNCRVTLVGDKCGECGVQWTHA